jgi:maltose O-acetyltransferase
VESLFSEIHALHPRLILVNMVLFFCPYLCFNRMRAALYRLCGVQIGRGTLVLGNLSMTSGPIMQRLRIGNQCLLNAPIHFDLNAEINIGDGVSIGHHVVFVTTDHEVGTADRRCGIAILKPITVGDGCWIGAGVTLLPGVTLGNGCVVSAGAVVSADVAPNKVVAGNPARPIKTLD